MDNANLGDASDPLEIVSAFVDGERVDSRKLKDALASEDARQYLVDAIALREMSAEDQHTDVAVFHERPLDWRRWTAMAAMVALSVAGGYLMGRRAVEPASSPTMTAALNPAPPAPAPTNVVLLPAGVNWEGAGGQ
jgi:hypothetical protein